MRHTDTGFPLKQVFPCVGGNFGIAFMMIIRAYVIACGNYVPGLLVRRIVKLGASIRNAKTYLAPFSFRFDGLEWAAGRARGIVVESPQDLHWQTRGLGAESPVFLPVRGQKNAPLSFFFLFV
jgi:hypothetical protein